MTTRAIRKFTLIFLCISVMVCIVAPSLAAQTASVTGGATQGPALTVKQQLGKAIFFDNNLSIQRNQACAACHAPESGWTGPAAMTNAHGAVYEGSIPGRFGNRKPPSAAYATQSPVFHFDSDEGLWEGGNFWDGRATGQKLGNPAADQAQGPFLNPKEQGLPDSACVVYRVCNATYASLIDTLVGPGACAISWPSDIDQVCQMEGTTVSLSAKDRKKSDNDYDKIALAIAAYEGSPEVNAFTSKFDYYRKGKAQLTAQERQGMILFQGKAMCANCHLSVAGAAFFLGPPPLFTDYTFDNLGTPKNPENPVYTYDPTFIDTGLGGFLKSIGMPAGTWEPEGGKQKVPTLRNLDQRPYPEFVKAYGHNGYFKSIEEIVHFYNMRDVLPTCQSGDVGEGVTCWPAPEYPLNVNHDELGNLHLTPAEEAAIVAFLKTLNDGYTPH